MAQTSSIVGDLINFRGLVYAPVNESGVVFLFGKVAEDFNMYIEEIKPGFPDCISRRFVGKGWERIAIEFEYKSSNFKAHGHDPNQCDLIVCWEHNWKDCPIEVLELKSEIKNLDNYAIKRPNASSQNNNESFSLDELFQKFNCNKNVQTWYNRIYQSMTDYDDNIWSKVSAKHVSWYSPNKTFVTFRLNKTSISFKCFSRGEPINDISKSGKRSPRWIKVYIQEEKDVEDAIAILKESHSRFQEAIEVGEATCYHSTPSMDDLESNDE